MKKLYSLLAFACIFSSVSAQITVTNSIVPQYTQGSSPTNNNRVPYYFWAELSGLTPGATYKYYTAMDTLGSSSTSNGAGNPLLINETSGTFRRTTNASLSNPANYDSLTASNTGTYMGWFGVEPTNNGRYTIGKHVHPQINMNNGAGGGSITNRVKLTGTMVKVINFGTTSGDTLRGSALFDSVSVIVAVPKMFVMLYDNVSGTGRPISGSVVEMDGINQNVVTSYENYYRDSVDQFNNRWGAIIPNANPNGIRYVEYRDFTNAVAQSTTYTDNDGMWCSGANTVNPGNGTTPLYLGENFSLQGTTTVPDTAYTQSGTLMSASTNGSGAQYTWDFGDGSPTDTNQSPTHTYAVPGTYTVTVIIQTPNCGITLTDTIIVLLGTSIAPVNPIANAFTLSPNPSSDGRIELHFANASARTITIFNTIGEQLRQQRNADQKMNFDLRDLPAGVYFVRVTENGNVFTRKLILK